MSEALTTKQAELLTALREMTQIKGFAPSVRELAKAVGLASTSSVSSHLRQLEEKGYIVRHPGSRALTILDPTDPVVAPITETERLTIRMTVLATLIELEESHPEATATAISHQLKPTLERLFLNRLTRATTTSLEAPQ